MIKVCILLMIIGLTSYIGVIYGGSFRKRRNELKDLEGSLLILQNEIVYTLTPLPYAILAMSNRAKEPLKSYFHNVYEDLLNNSVESAYESFLNNYNKNKKDISLKGEDMEILFDLAKSLGETGVYGQDKLFSMVNSRIKTQIKLKEEECIKNEKLYKCLGVCLGGMLVIFLL